MNVAIAFNLFQGRPSDHPPRAPVAGSKWISWSWGTCSKFYLMCCLVLWGGSACLNTNAGEPSSDTCPGICFYTMRAVQKRTCLHRAGGRSVKHTAGELALPGWEGIWKAGKRRHVAHEWGNRANYRQWLSTSFPRLVGPIALAWGHSFTIFSMQPLQEASRHGRMIPWLQMRVHGNCSCHVKFYQGLK